MFEKIKHTLGIEGLRVALTIDEPVDFAGGLLRGRVHLTTLRPQTVRSLGLTLTETYSRGRGEQRRVDDYVLGAFESQTDLSVGANESLSIPFSLRFAERLSPFEVASRGRLAGPLRSVARVANAASSKYVLRATAQVAGVALDAVGEVEVRRD